MQIWALTVATYIKVLPFFSLFMYQNIPDRYVIHVQIRSCKASRPVSGFVLYMAKKAWPYIQAAM